MTGHTITLKNSGTHPMHFKEIVLYKRNGTKITLSNASASSVYSGRFPNMGIDGDTNTYFETNGVSNSWWKADFNIDNIFNLGVISLSGRTDPGAGTQRNIGVTVYIDSKLVYTIVNHQGTYYLTPGEDGKYTLRDSAMTGNKYFTHFLRLKKSSGTVSLREISLIDKDGRAIPIINTTPNDTKSGLGIDGNTNTYVKYTSNNPYWQGHFYMSDFSYLDKIKFVPYDEVIGLVIEIDGKEVITIAQETEVIMIKYNGGTSFKVMDVQAFTSTGTGYSQYTNKSCSNSHIYTENMYSNVECEEKCDSMAECRYYSFNNSTQNCKIFKLCDKTIDANSSVYEVNSNEYIAKLDRVNAKLKDDLSSLSSELTTTSTNLDSKIADVNKLSTSIKSLTSKLSGYDSADTDIEADVTALNKALGDMETNIKSLKDLEETNATLLAHKQKIIDNTTLSLEEKNTALDKTLALIDSNNDAIDAANKSLTITQALIAAKNNELQSIQEELEEAEKDSGFIQALTDFVDYVSSIFTF
jgi:hypothetical protein